MTVAVIFAGGLNRRLKKWIRNEYDKDIPKLMLALGKEGKPFLQYNIETAMEVFDEVYVLTMNPEIAEFAESLGAQGILHPHDYTGRSGHLRYSIERGYIPKDHIVTMNGSDIIDKEDLIRMRDHRGNALLLAKEYYGGMPEFSKPNVAHYHDGRIQYMKRELYDPDEDGAALHTGVSRIAVDLYERLGSLKFYTNIEETLFEDLIEEGIMGYIMAEGNWYPLKHKGHVEDYRELEF